jgi:hypothetical protein
MRRRTLLQTAAASLLAAPAIAQPAKTATLHFVPQANLKALEPIFTTPIVNGNHAGKCFYWFCCRGFGSIDLWEHRRLKNYGLRCRRDERENGQKSSVARS